TAAIRRVVESGDSNSKLGVANMIAEMGPDVRGTSAGEKLELRRGFARALTPEIVQLAGEADLRGRQEALPALGNIFPLEKEAADVFKKALETDELGPRRLAAEGLVQMVRVVNHLQKKTAAASGVDATRQDLLRAVTEAVRASAAGMRDPDPQ